MKEEVVFGVSDFVASINQTLDYAYSSISIVGEVANLRVSKGKWVYFDLKDEESSVKFFGTVYQLPGPLEDGLMLQVRGVPRLHQIFGFSVNVQFIKPVGEGSLKRTAQLLEIKLEKEGLFEPERKRSIPFPPKSIGLITSGESAAYQDFIKIISKRWGGLDIYHADVQVQGEPAINQIVSAINYFNSYAQTVDVLVITRGGGSSEDLSVFNNEQITRSVGASRIPTLVAIGHERDISLSERAADRRASTPSNAAELLVPDRKAIISSLRMTQSQLYSGVLQVIRTSRDNNNIRKDRLAELINHLTKTTMESFKLKRAILESINPRATISRGYAIIRDNGNIVTSVHQLKNKMSVDIELKDGSTKAEIVNILDN